MEIPTLAVKCRFCGEEVGRPRDESRQLSINDLGGETITRYAPSGNVIDAIEAYRAEMQAEMDAAEEARNKPRESIFSRRAKQPGRATQPQHTSDPQLSLNKDNEALASIGISTPPIRTRTQTPPPSRPTWMRQIAFLGSFIAVAVLLVLGVFQVFAVVQDFWGRDEGPGPSGFVNQAPEIIERGGAPLDALRAAVEALEHDRTSRNEEILERTVQLVVEQVEHLLKDSEWQFSNVQQASQIAHQASDLYPSSVTRQIRENAKEEVFMYQMSLISADEAAGSAILNITARDGQRERIRVSAGDTINGRFIVKSVRGDRVMLEDTQRDDRHGRDRTVTVDLTGVR
jgi:hypothetical protein